MRKGIHPKYNKVVFVDGEHRIVTRSVVTSKKQEEIDGETVHVIPIEISAYTHPFFTGKQKIIDTEGRVERFKKRYNFSR